MEDGGDLTVSRGLLREACCDTTKLALSVGHYFLPR